MQRFEFIEDVEAWVEPMGYETFWQAIEPYGIFGPEDRAHCDHTLADGIAPMDTVMAVTKGMFCMEMRLAHDLRIRPILRPSPRLEVID